MKYLLLLSLCYLGAFATGPIINIGGLGQIQGKVVNTGKGNITANAYLNIPFAAPPLGNLLFEKPQPALPLSGVREGSEYGAGCVPHVRAGAQGPFNDDCLTINIITPAKVPVVKKPLHLGGLPVIIYFPAGGFETGTMAIYGPEGLANVFATENVIVVSAQYRLGPYGFLSTGDARLPGNIGIWDQIEALKFLKAHIADFGGDPNRITVWGISATGCSVGQLTLTPKAYNLFSRTIEQSGSPFANWAAGTTVVENSKQYITAIGCDPTATAADLKNCLRSKSNDNSLDAVEAIGSATDDFAWLKFGPVVDGDLFKDYPHKLIKDAPPKPSIQGVGNKDGGYFTLADIGGGVCNWNITAQISTWGESDLINTINRLFRQPKLYGNRSDEATDEIINYYVNEERGKGPRDNAFYLDIYNQLFTDVMWHVPHTDGVKIKSAWGWPVWAYSMDHFNNAGFVGYGMNNIPTRARGSFHVNEVIYTMGLPFYGPYDITTTEEIRVTRLLQQSFVNFVKTGNPINQELLLWAPYNKLFGNYASIQSQPKLKNQYHAEAWNFWNDMRNKYGFDVITLTKTIKPTLPPFVHL